MRSHNLLPKFRLVVRCEGCDRRLITVAPPSAPDDGRFAEACAMADRDVQPQGWPWRFEYLMHCCDVDIIEPMPADVRRSLDATTWPANPPEADDEPARLRATCTCRRRSSTPWWAIGKAFLAGFGNIPAARAWLAAAEAAGDYLDPARPPSQIRGQEATFRV